MKLKLLIGFLILLILGALAAGGLVGYRFFFAPKHDDAIALVPDDAWAYFSVFLDPSTQQKMAIEDLLSKTPLEDFDEAAERLKGLFDEGLQASDCSFEEDFEPWIGDQVAGFALPPAGAGTEVDGAVLVAVEDETAARDAYYECNESDIEVEDERTYKDVDYEITSTDDAIAMIDGFAVIGNEGGVKAAIDAGEGETLEESERYQDAFEDLTEDRLAAMYVDLEPVLDGVGEDATMTPEDVQELESLFGDSVETPITATVSLRSDAVVLEGSYGIPDDGFFRDVAMPASSQVLGDLPGDSWLAFGLGNFGDYVQSLLHSISATGAPEADQERLERQVRKETGLDLQNDILEWMGDVGLFVRGTSLFSIDGGVVIETTDPDTAIGTVAVLGQYLAEQGIPVTPTDVGDARGFTIAIPGVPQRLNVVVGNERAVIAYGDDATQQALEPEDPLAESDAFADAAEVVGSEFDISAYVEVAPIVQLVEGLGETDETYDEDVKPFLDSVKYVAFGTKVTDEKGISRLVVGVE